MGVPKSRCALNHFSINAYYMVCSLECHVLAISIAEFEDCEAKEGNFAVSSVVDACSAQETIVGGS